MENATNPPSSASKTVGGGGDNKQMKRDEWSEVAVSSLLQAYEAKWVSRNRAKLKGQDWVEVARFVSTTADAPKTQTQCKNKIESMKKRYRSESASNSTSTWPMFERIHLLLTGHNNNHTTRAATVAVRQIIASSHLHPIESSPVQVPSPVPFSVQFPTGQNQLAAAPSAIEPNGVVFSPTKQEEDGAKARQDKTDHSSSTSTNPAFDIHKLRPTSSSTMKRRKKKKKSYNGMQSCGNVIAESVRLVAEAVVRTEEARMETMRELERMRAETEMRRGEMELKRTQIIVDTQLEIARLIMSCKGAQGTTTPSSFQPGQS